MSVDFIVYTNRRDVPDGHAFSRRLAAAGQRVRIPEPPDFLHEEGFLPVLLDGKPSGFEVDVSPITDEDRADYREDLRRDRGSADDDYYEILTACDLIITFFAHAGDEAAAAEVVARELAISCRGYFSDPQVGEITPPVRVTNGDRG